MRASVDRGMRTEGGQLPLAAAQPHDGATVRMMRFRLLAAAEFDAESLADALAQLGVLFFKAERGRADSLLRAGRIMLVPAAAGDPTGPCYVPLWEARPADFGIARPDPTPPFEAPPARPQPVHDLSTRHG